MFPERRDDEPVQSLLSRDSIKWHIDEGNIVISPFKDENLKTVSYDVGLGPNFYRSSPERVLLYNPWDEKVVRKFWGDPIVAPTALAAFNSLGRELPEHVDPNDQIIFLQPNELILAHTDEFIGGRKVATTMMKARSSMGRSGITVCKCAGWGDVGYINRWTMEIKNELSVPNLLIVGERIAQIAFYQVDPINGGDYSKEEGKYQTSSDLEELKRKWIPEAMLPKLWKDRENK